MTVGFLRDTENPLVLSLDLLATISIVEYVSLCRLEVKVKRMYTLYACIKGEPSEIKDSFVWEQAIYFYFFFYDIFNNLKIDLGSFYD